MEKNSSWIDDVIKEHQKRNLIFDIYIRIK